MTNEAADTNAVAADAFGHDTDDEFRDIGSEFATWIDELPDGLIVCRPDGTIRVVNDRLIEMSGYTERELIGSNIDILVPTRSRDRHESLRNGFVDANRARPMGPGMQLSLERKDQTEVPVEISLSPLSTGVRRGVVAIVRDVTERLRAETVLRTTSDLLTLAGERERIARDLHDTVLQRLFGLGLELQATAIRSPDVSDRLEHAVDEIDLIIREIRTAVFTLGSAGRDGSLGQELATVTAQAKRVLGYSPRVRLDGPVESAMTPEIRTELLASLREALTNIARHAGATEAEVELVATDVLTLRVLDNGRGMPSEFDTSSGNGLRNMAERARLLGGGCALGPRPDKGTQLSWWVPLTN
jgi:two-component system sensor histidine kinase DevS